MSRTDDVDIRRALVRIDHLERRYRRLRRICLAVGLATIGPMLVAATSHEVSDVIRVKRLEIVDATGVWTIDGRSAAKNDTQAAAAVLSIARDGRIASNVFQTEHGSGIATYDEEERRRTVLGAYEGGAHIMAFNGMGRPVAGLGAGPGKAGHGIVTLTKANGSLAVTIAALDHGGNVGVHNSNQEIVAMLGTTEQSTGSFTIFAPKGRESIVFGTESHGGGGMQVFDGKGRQHLGIRSGTKGSVIVHYDRDGEPDDLWPRE